MDDRIRLAEAMDVDPNLFGPMWGNPIFDPFKDANHDVAVNKWAIKNLDPDAYFAALSEVVGNYCYLHEYRIGYFASAALKVLERDDE